MSSLAQKYRPRRFADLWQGLDNPTIKIVTRELAQNRLSSPTVFTAPYGGGKTSITRNIGLRGSCEQPDQHAFEPCLTCKACKSVLKELNRYPIIYNPYGYIEADCARMAPEKIIDFIMEVTTYVRMYSKKSPFEQKFIALDEFGRYGEAQQRKFLKLIETTRALFIICIADEDKLDKAICQRCSIRPLRLPSIDICTQRIVDVVQKEDKTVSTDAARLLAQRCGNNPRDILKVLDDALLLCNGQLDITSVEGALSMRFNQ